MGAQWRRTALDFRLRRAVLRVALHRAPCPHWQLLDRTGLPPQRCAAASHPVTKGQKAGAPTLVAPPQTLADSSVATLSAAVPGRAVPIPAVGVLRVVGVQRARWHVPPVTVTGPRRYRKVIHASTRLRDLTPGTYHVTGTPLPGKGRTYYPAVTGTPALVGRAAHPKVVVSYLDYAPDTTLAPPASAVLSATGQPGSAQTVTLAGPDGGLPHAPAVGDIIALGSTPKDA